MMSETRTFDSDSKMGSSTLDVCQSTDDNRHGYLRSAKDLLNEDGEALLAFWNEEEL